jgi:hypothetical protein
MSVWCRLYHGIQSTYTHVGHTAITVCDVHFIRGPYRQHVHMKGAGPNMYWSIFLHYRLHRVLIRNRRRILITLLFGKYGNFSTLVLVAKKIINGAKRGFCGRKRAVLNNVRKKSIKIILLAKRCVIASFLLLPQHPIPFPSPCALPLPLHLSPPPAPPPPPPLLVKAVVTHIFMLELYVHPVNEFFRCYICYTLGNVRYIYICGYSKMFLRTTDLVHSTNCMLYALNNIHFQENEETAVRNLP